MFLLLLASAMVLLFAIPVALLLWLITWLVHQ
jgi:hypothetical protein